MIRTILMMVLLAMASMTYAAEIEGHKFEDKITVEGKELLLNGVGLRTINRFGLNFKVYVAGLYVEKRSTKDKDIMESGGLVHLKSYYLREVTKKQQKEPFREAIRKNCYADCSDSKKKIFKIIDAVMRTKEGGAFDFTFFKDRVTFFMNGENGESRVTVPGATFSKDMLAIWMGPKPPTDELKEGLLGKGMDWTKTANNKPEEVNSKSEKSESK